MKKFWYVALGVVLAAGSFWAGTQYMGRKAEKIHVSGLKLVAVSSSKVPENDTVTPSLASGGVRISPDKQQAIGVQLASVERKAVTQTLRALGRVTADETRIYRINAAVDGWITEAFPNRVGTLVKKDEVLASFYSTEIIAAQQTYFVYALGGTSSLSQPAQPPGREALLLGSPRLSVQQYRDSLKNLGMSEAQIEEIARTRQYAQRIHILSPAKGFVVFRNVSPGERFEKGKELYRIADLSRMWIQADVFENEGQYLKPGMKVKARVPNQNRTFLVKISNVLPLFDSTTRTLKIGMEAENPGYFLRPDMFVDLELPVESPPAITVPADAILDSGLRKTVFTERGVGIFEPREVETGWRMGNRVEIVKGLEPGERIAISGNFLIDSESKLGLAAASPDPGLAKDPVCGRELSPKKAEKARRKISYNGEIFYFCSDECQQHFEKESNHFINAIPDQTSRGNSPPPGVKKNKGHDHS